MQSVIDKQSESIEDLKRDFNNKLTELQRYLDEEVQNYNFKVRALIDAQKLLADMKAELEAEKAHAIDAFEKYEAARNEYERLIQANRNELDRYDEPDELHRKAPAEIDSLKNQLAEK